MAEVIAQQSSLKSLIAKGKEQGYLTYSEVNDHLPDTISDPDQVEDIIQMINDMGIKVFETAPDADSLPAATGSAGHRGACRSSSRVGGRSLLPAPCVFSRSR